MTGSLGRRVPDNFDHVTKYPLSAIRPVAVAQVEKVLSLPYWHKSHDQGQEGSCVGHGWAMERGITNTRQNILSHLPWPTVRRYNPIQIWNHAKEIDGWPDTNPGDDNGTSVHAGGDSLRTVGAQRVKSMQLTANVPRPVFPGGVPYPVDLIEGIVATRWAVNVDEARDAIANLGPVVIGINWYSNFDTPRPKGNEYWIGEGTLGTVRGGHCVCLYGASDKRQAFKLKNSWGQSYPEVWLPYATLTRLLSENGEVALTTDR
jgi:hypothetical protein